MGSSRRVSVLRLSLPTLLVATALTYGCNLLLDVSGYHPEDASSDAGLDASGIDAGDASADVGPGDAGPDVQPPPGALANKWAAWRMPNYGDAAGPSLSYEPVASPAGAVKDTTTGLTWVNSGVNPRGYEKAKSTCEGISKSENFRLPTRIELVSLLDFAQTTGAKASPTSGLGLLPVVHWTQSYLPPQAGQPYSFWLVDFATGSTVVQTDSAATPITASLLCVKGL